MELDEYTILRINLYALTAIHNMQMHEEKELYKSNNKKVIDFVNSIDYNKLLDIPDTETVQEIIEHVKSQLMKQLDRGGN